jgi:hypothetical protein
MRKRRHQVLIGGDYTWRHKTSSCHDFVTSTVYSGSLSADAEYGAIERTAAGYLRDDIEVARWLHATVGARYVDGIYQDPGQTTVEYRVHRLNPYAGASMRVAPSITVQAAAFRNTNSDFLSATIAPPTVAGFVFERNELPTSQRDEADVAVQSGWRRSFIETRAFVRSTKAPAFRVTGDDPNPLYAQFADYLTPPDADSTAHGISIFFNQIVTRQLALFADEQYIVRDARAVDRHDNQLRVGLNYIHPLGIYAKVATRFLKQSFSNTAVVGLPESSFALTDASVQYEFSRKRGLLTLSATNLFNRAFRAIIENLAVESPLPYRTVVLSLRWRI